jgi:hypothetical protein
MLDEYRAAIEQARAELDRLRPVLAAIDDVSSAARLEEVDLSLLLIASNMLAHSAGGHAIRARLAELRRRMKARRQRASAWLIGRVLGELPWL